MSLKSEEADEGVWVSVGFDGFPAFQGEGNQEGCETIRRWGLLCWIFVLLEKIRQPLKRG